MKIAMVSEHASPLALLGGADAGGQNVYVAALARELGQRGHDVTVYTRRESTAVPRRAEYAPNVIVEHVDAGPPEPIAKDDIWPHIDRFASELHARWRQRRPDVAHAHFWMSGVAAMGAARGLDVPVLQTFHALGAVKRRHQGPADTSPEDRLANERWLLQEVDGVIATCSDEAFELRALGADPSRISIVPCGVDTDRFTADGPVRGRGGIGHRLVTISRLVPRKGIDDAIRALASVPDTELLVAGGPAAEHLHQDAEVGRLMAVAREEGVHDRVSFLGALDRDTVPPLLRSADAVLATPWYEPFGIVPLEAMATGVPVIASAVGGMIDTVADGVTGLHVPPRDPDAISSALRRLLADDGWRRALGSAGVDRVRRRYTWQRVADGVMDAYEHARGGVEVPAEVVSL